jgi:NAD(P)-dependent dehydrogenase (short-subunit alcohol dehydrogenase family)
MGGEKVSLKGNVAIVTGGGQGIGRGIALRLAKEGADVAVADMNSETPKKVAEEIKKLGRQSIPISADLTKSVEVEKMIKMVIEQFGKIDILVNDAGGVPGKGLEREQFMSILETDEKDWDATIQANLKTTFLCSKAVAKNMVERKSGKIINISSVGGITYGTLGGARTTYGPKPLIAAYGAAKAGILSFTRSLARELSPYHINVNAVCPGLIDSPLSDRSSEELAKLQGITIEEARKRRISAIPWGRIGTPDDIAAVVAFLASSDADFITGEEIIVSGGA